MTPVSRTFADLTFAITEAERLARLGDWRAARDRYESLLAADHAGEDPFNRLLIAERVADIGVTLGDYAEAGKLYEALTLDYGARQDWTRADIALLKRVHIALSEERLADAVLLLRAIEARTGPLEALSFSGAGVETWEAKLPWTGSERPLALAQFYLEGGRILAATGIYSEAMEGFRRGLAHCTKAPELVQASLALRLAIAACRMERGDPDGAREELAQVTEDGSLSAAPGVSALYREISAKLHLLQGNLAAAEAELSSVLRLCRSLGAVRGSARAALNLAELQVMLNRIPEAMANLDAASALDGGDMRGRIARVREWARNRSGGALGEEWLALPVLSMQFGRGMAGTARADVIVESSQSDKSRPLSYLAFYEVREMDFLARLTAGHRESAGPALRRMHEDFDGADSLLIRARLRVLAAALAAEAGDYRSAETLLQVSREEFRGMWLRPELYQCGRMLALCQEKLGFPMDRVRALGLENDALLDDIAHSLGPEDRALYLVDKWSTRETVLGREIDELAHLRAIAAESKGLRKAWLAYRSLARLNALINRIAEVRASGPENAAARQPLWRRLLRSPGTAEIGFVPLPNCTLTWAAGWLHLRCRITAAPRIRIRELVAAWQRDAPAEDPRSRNRTARTSRELAKCLGLFELFGGLGTRVRHLTFCPDDQLNGFPFAALPVSEEPGAPYAGIRWSTSVAFPERRISVRRPARVRSATVAGVAEAQGYKPLPDVPAQSAAIRQWLGSRGVRTEMLPGLGNTQVTRQALLEALRGSQLFHYGGHGLLRLDRPELSGLVLTEPDAEGQVLSLGDIVSVPLRRMEHATIAACWAADSFVLPGRTVGFTKLLIDAGAGSVLAPLWEIDDRISGLLLQSFYMALPGKSRGEALRCAREYVIAKGYTNPFWWAGFQLYGQHGRMRI